MSLCSHQKISICMQCNSPVCEQCTQEHSNHKCVPKNQIANHILNEFVVPAENQVLEKLQKAIELFTDVFYLIKKGIVQQFGLSINIEELAQKSERELPDLLIRINNLKKCAADYLEQIQAALTLPQESIILTAKEPQSTQLVKQQQDPIKQDPIKQDPKKQDPTQHTPMKSHFLKEDLNFLDQIKNQEDLKQIEKLVKEIDQPKKIEQVIKEDILQQNNRIQNQGQQLEEINQQLDAQPDLTEYYFILQELSKHKQKFRDEEFPPNDASLGVDQGYIWKRIASNGQVKLFPKKTGNVFGIGNSVKSSDIISGTQGNEVMYGLAYLFANHCPDILKECFITQDISPEGIYALKLNFLNGTQNIIYVDDFCPFDPIVQLHVTLMGTDYSIWIMLLEKAIAKLIGSYFATIQQHWQMIIRYLTPALPILLDTAFDDIFEKMEQQLRQGALILATPIENNQGLSLFNFYQIADIVTLNQDLQLFKLRNPWGAKQWMGNWSHSSSEWTQQFKSRINLEEEGFFYMDLFSLMQQFHTLYCYQVYDRQQDSIMVSSRRNQAIYCKLTVSEEQECFISVFTENLLVNIKQFQKFVIFKETNNTYTFIEANMSYIGLSSVQFKAKKGTYIIYCKLLWDKDGIQDAKISVFGRKPMKIIQIQKIQNILYQGFTQAAEKQGMLQKFDCGSWKILDLLYHGWYMILIKNDTPLFQSYALKFQQFKYATMCKPFNLIENQLQFHLNSNTQELFIIKGTEQSLIQPALYNCKQNYY